MIKRATAHVKRRWNERAPDAGLEWAIVGIVTVILIVAITWYVALPAFLIMVAAWAIHQVWESFPAISYWSSVLAIIGFYIVGRAVGFLLRALIMGITKGMR